jgi:lysophospholipase L1-like esterase
VLLPVTACRSSPSSGAPGAPEPFRPRNYAALGDSYAAGEGLPPFEPGSGDCDRSPSAYPRLVAAQEGSALNFAPCAGAMVADVVGAGQLATVDPNADLVTVTMGGNDLEFARVVADCLVGAQPCSTDDADVEAALQRLGPALEDGYRQIKARAPRARIVVVGYPQLVADPARADLDTCPSLASPLPGRRIDAADGRWLREKGARLSAVVAGAARAVGVSYVDVAADFAGHEACSADPWLTGVILTNLRASFHPTPAGQAELARLVIAALA